MPTFPFTLASIFGDDASAESLTLAQITDHVERARLRVLEQYKEKPNLDALLTIYVERLQTVEDAFWQLYEQRSLDTAEGAQLDQIGRILKLPRGGYSDNDYRLHLRAQIKLLKSSGTIDQLLEIAALVVPGATLEFVEAFPAGFTLRVSGIATDLTTAQLLSKFIRLGRPGAVYALLEFQGQTDAETFTWDENGLGWDDGLFAAALVS